jgi:hypothetical protein
MDVQIKCICPAKDGEPRHPSDTVTLRDRLDYRSVTTIRKSMETVWYEDKAVQLAERLAVCTEFYMLMGISSWTLEDERGKPVPVSHSAIREMLFESSEVVRVSEVAEEAYNRVVLLPLMEGASISSPPRQTDELTSPKSEPTTPPKPSKPSSISTTRTGDIETITSLPVGGSSSSQSKASAA